MKNACIVGFGAIGPVHAAALSDIANVRIAAVCDIKPARAEAAAEKYGATPFCDFEEMLRSGCADTVHICTPHYLHKDMAVAAMAVGCDVVLEKPAAMNSAELDELLAAENSFGGRLCVMLQNRTNYCIETLLSLISDQEKSGRVLTVNGSMTWKRDADYYRADEWRGKWSTEGGGLLINQAIHLIDLMGIIGGGISAVRGGISNRWLGGIIEVEDTADAIFEFANGSRGCFYATNSAMCSSPIQLEVFCEKVHYRYADNTLYRITDGRFDGVICRDSDGTAGKKVWGTGHRNVLGEFYGGGSYPSLADAENSARALYAFYESAKRGGERVEIKIK